MTADEVHHLLSHPPSATAFWGGLGVRDPHRANQNLVSIGERRVPLDVLANLLAQLQSQLPALSDPDRALNNLDRFIAAARSPLSLLSLFEREPTALPHLLQIFANSQHFSDLLIRDGESYDSLRLTEGQPLSRESLVTEIRDEISKVALPMMAMNLLRRFKQRQMLRIAYGDLVGKQRLDEIATQISYVAEAVCAAAVQFCHDQLVEKFGTPRHEDGKPAAFAVLALGKLGGVELNYSSDIDLITFYSADGATDGRRSLANREFFDRLAREFVKLLTESTELGMAYRVDLRLRPDGAKGPITISQASLLHYYDVRGRTWERQALIKARCIAGDETLGRETLRQLEHWIYRKYLTRFEIQGIKALKRQIERKVEREGEDHRNIKTGRGGIRDVEFVIQFLQLLHGADRRVRTHSTLAAIDRLSLAGCLTTQEAYFLRDNYSWLRKLEHRLQVMFDLQTHSLPVETLELDRLANRMDVLESDNLPRLDAFRSQLQEVTALNRKILNHLLHNAFPADDSEIPAEEMDLILDPDISPERVQSLLARYGFHDSELAFRHLLSLSDEKIPFLNPRRCRHFLAAIVQSLLQSIGQTPDPESTLIAMDKVCNSIGGKAVLWELFSYNRPSMNLCVKLCATSSYLTELLTCNPGMVDGLLDSLTLKSLPTRHRMQQWLKELITNVDDLQSILVGFKNHMHLQIGVRDILARDTIQQTHQALADVAELCVHAVAEAEWKRAVARYGEPVAEDGSPCRFVILAMGKLAGSEPNYHSDLDVIFLFESPGHTNHADPSRQTTNQHFFAELGTKIVKAITTVGRHGKLFELDCRLRPTGKSGSLAVSFEEFDRYFRSGAGQTWERLALCKARPIYGEPTARQNVMQKVRQALTAQPWRREFVNEIRQMRYRMQENANPLNLKRGPGGTVDIEFIVQMLQLKYASVAPKAVRPGTMESLIVLQQLGCLSEADCQFLARSYRRLRAVEARIRLINTSSRHDFPADEIAQRKLAYLLNMPSAESLEREMRRYLVVNRQCFERIFDHHAADVTPPSSAKANFSTE